MAPQQPGTDSAREPARAKPRTGATNGPTFSAGSKKGYSAVALVTSLVLSPAGKEIGMVQRRRQIGTARAFVVAAAAALAVFRDAGQQMPLVVVQTATADPCTRARSFTLRKYQGLVGLVCFPVMGVRCPGEGYLKASNLHRRLR